ncbi:lysine methyltransferase 5Ab [Kryptolebias marmoratus]|uniref:[histone H4]-lysine(20) N-methyltransferase n=1 Tax=Kryptolebias marmoratus TaxID=37003 RepID=A0A3Q3B7K5_KRYMA|nr:lysine methyltransferase 5Ab [Kryptolebias marmoratus]
MAKGKKTALKNNKKSENSVGQIDPSQTETKENKPAANKDRVGKVQSTLQSFRTPRKSRSPLSDNSSMLIQEGKDLDASNPDLSKLKPDMPGKIKSDSCESKEQPTEVSRQSNGTRKQASDQPKQQGSSTQSNVKSAANAQLPASKPQSKTGQKTRAKKKENKALQNRKVTDYFPIRRSGRKTKTELKSEEDKLFDDLIKNGTEKGMQVKHIEGKGRGVFAVTGFKKGDFVVEYHGDLLDLTEAKRREAEYSKDPETGCYMYYFQYQSKTYCVDATKETGRLGRLLNHSKSGNCQTRLHAIDGTPHLVLVASRDIDAEEELLYDYGDRSKDSISAHPWLKH